MNGRTSDRVTRSPDAAPTAHGGTTHESVGRAKEPRTVVGRLLCHCTYSQWVWAYLFLLPGLIFFVVFTLYPMVNTFHLSMHHSYSFYQEPRFVGFYNYTKLWKDALWWMALRNTVVYTALTAPVLMSLSLLLALLIRPFGRRIQGLLRGIFYLPGVTSVVVISLIWLWIYYPFENGLANYLIGLVGIESQLWLGDTRTALPAIIFMVWMTGQGANVVLYSAALNNIPTSLYEAADLDCAGGWAKFAHVTWPLIKPTTLYVTVTATIGSFQVFGLVYTMTGGGPGYSTRTLVFQVYDTAFRCFNFGYASAQAVVLALLIVVVAVFQFRYLATEVEY
ncbi:MAG: carbohydrate ABC transporter permease [bacterium]